VGDHEHRHPVEPVLRVPASGLVVHLPAGDDRPGDLALLPDGEVHAPAFVGPGMQDLAALAQSGVPVEVRAGDEAVQRHRDVRLDFGHGSSPPGRRVAADSRSRRRQEYAREWRPGPGSGCFRYQRRLAPPAAPRQAHTSGHYLGSGSGSPSSRNLFEVSWVGLTAGRVACERPVMPTIRRPGPGTDVDT
jgi:hypothetical protein